MEPLPAAGQGQEQNMNASSSAHQSQPRELKQLYRFDDNELSGESAVDHGGFGQVIHRKWNRNGKEFDVAEKQLITYSTKGDERNLEHEAEMLVKIRHKHVVKLHGVRFTANKDFCLVMEYMRYGSCNRFFNTPFKEDTMPLKYRIAIQVAETMIYLHSRKPRQILHLDLKSANVLLDDRLNVKGRQRALVGPALIWHRNTCDRQKVNQQQNQTCTDAMEHSIWKNNVISGERPDLELVPNPSPKELVHCMIQSWKQRPEDRPEFYEIYKQLHPFPYEAAFIERLVTGLLLSPNLNPKRFLPAQVSAPTATNRHAHPHTLERRTGDFSPSVFNFDRSEDQTVAKQPVNLHVHPSQSSNWHDSGNASLASSGQNVRLNTGEFSHTICSDEAPLIQTSIPELNETEAVQPTNSKRFGGCCKATRIVPAVLVIVAIGVAFPFVYLHLARGGPCPSLPSPDQYKSISCHPPVNPGANQVASGTVCEIFCKTGYGIKNGSSQITCEKPGIWSESKPVCSKLAVCPSLPDPANGGSTNCTDSSYEMSVCQFSCPPGFRLRYESSAGLNIDSKTSTTCRVTSGTAKWDLPVPYCEKVSVCPSLPNPTTGKYDCNAVSVTSVAGTSYNNGTICNLDCYQGYAVDGNNAVQCQDNSAWNKTKLFCQQTCPKIIAPSNGEMNCTHQNFFSSVCNFQCNTNFAMLGYQRTSCQRNSAWTRKPALCVCPACRSGESCEYVCTWDDLVERLNKSAKAIMYVGHEITCIPPTAGTKSCICRDKITQHGWQCNAQTTLYENCRQSLSTLVSLMAFDHLYPLPCDADKMPQRC